MPNLLDLPQEIRDDIWVRAIHQSQPVCTARNYRRCSRTILPRAKITLVNVVDCGPLRSTSLNLLLVNRQIYDEVTKNIDFLRRNNRLCYTVSSTHREGNLVLFWANLPVLSHHVDVLQLEVPVSSTDGETISTIRGYVREALETIWYSGLSAPKSPEGLRRPVGKACVTADVVLIKLMQTWADAGSVAGSALKDDSATGFQGQGTQHSVISLFTSHLIEALETEVCDWRHSSTNVFRYFKVFFCRM
ncbi:uncharacterized protein BDZ99DRAFT_150441 [Mytilinidion resinicola]|uniref:F-box domain-containing protein n=1 Tax=Mytilinidion resinicola TaxID=574789 RepID=A0A6A6Y7V3_9PEZI|nr:uncharacterized protein BDZ99DRAFT_150441 [Mytilinidion resinicola]KAF2804689.1 hypothetical protein BDZ99DRAFT_150441 [Mytilinidion resinicola]